MKCAIFEEHSSSCVVYFRFSGTLFPVSMIDGDAKKHVWTSGHPQFLMDHSFGRWETRLFYTEI